jgi:hypothetical protein
VEKEAGEGGEGGRRRWRRRQEEVEKEAELEENKIKYIRQVDVKEINEEWFLELVGELDMERAMAESVAEGPASVQAMMQDKEVGESKQEKSAEEAPEVAAVVVKLSTIGKGKQKAAPARAKVYAEVEGLVSRLSKSTSICANTSSHSATDV